MLLAVVVLNAVLVLAGFGVWRGKVSVKLITPLMHGIHGTLGITAPTEEQVRYAVAVWIVLLLAICDVLYAMFLYIF
jgi:hypothetical protein